MKALNKLIIVTILITIALPFSSEANVKSRKEQANQVLKEISKWHSSKESTFKTGNSTSSFKAYIKYNNSYNKEYPIASVTNFKTSNPSVSTKKIINTIKEALIITNWDEKRTLNGVDVYGVHLKHLKRYVRIFIKTKNGITQYSTATFKESSLIESSVETELIQRTLFKLHKKKSKRFVWNKLFHRFIISEARATKLPDVGEISGAVSDKANEAVSVINRKMKLAGKDVEKISNYLKDNGKKLYQQLENIINGPVGKTVQGISDLGEGVNRLSKLFSNPGKLFLSSAAVALGGLSVSIIGSGIGQLGEFLWELISGEKNKQQLIKRFNEEKENWEKNQKSYNELENLFKNTLKLLKNGTQINMSKADIFKLKVLQRKIKAKIKIGDKNLEKFLEEDNDSCADKEAIKIEKLESVNSTVSGLIRFGNTKEDESGKSALCLNLESIFARLQTIDKELQQSRAALSNPEITRVWQELWQDSEITQRKDLSSQNEENYKKIFEDRIKFLKDRHGNDLETLKVSIQSKLSTCATKKVYKRCMENPQGEFRILKKDTLQFFCQKQSGDNLLHKTALRSCKRSFKRKHKNYCQKNQTTGEYRWSGEVDSKNYFYNKCRLKIDYWLAKKDAKDRLERNLQTLKTSTPRVSDRINDDAYTQNMKWFEELQKTQIDITSLVEKRRRQKADLNQLCAIQ